MQTVTRTSSFFDRTSQMARRAKLVRLCRKAFRRYEAAKIAQVDADCAPVYCPDECQIARRIARQRLDRYQALRDTLAREAGLPANVVHYQIAVQFPLVPALTANI